MRKAEKGLYLSWPPPRAGEGSLSTMETTPVQLGLWGWWRAERLSREPLIHWEALAWGLGGSWRLATLQLVDRGAERGGGRRGVG